MLKFHTEFIGMFFITVAVGFSAEPFAVGLLMVALVYMFSGFSGAHFNPAVTFAAWITDDISTRHFTTNLTAQAAGAVAGAFFIWWITGSSHLQQPNPSMDTFGFAALELVFSFLFVLVFLFMMYPLKRRKNPVFGLVIGLAFAGCYFITEPSAGSGLNPAFASAFVLTDFIGNGYSYYYLPVYFFAPMIGGVLAGLLYKHYINLSAA
jgi:aquaporin Z